MCQLPRVWVDTEARPKRGKPVKLDSQESWLKREQNNNLTNLNNLCNDGGSRLGCKVHSIIRFAANHATLASALQSDKVTIRDKVIRNLAYN